MILPEFDTSLTKSNFFFYTACDSAYFDEFGIVLANSIKKNTDATLHFHLFNPKEEQLEYCRKMNISLSYENVDIKLFQKAADKWNQDNAHKERKREILQAMAKSGDKEIIERMQKTYFACARFIRLSQLLSKPTSMFAIDVDAVVRKSIPVLNKECDFYIHKNRQFLAGGIYLTGTQNSLRFLQEYSSYLTENILRDDLYWTLDQAILDNIVPKYEYSELPRSLIDWDMKPDSCIWTAKGRRKELNVFKQEQSKYRN
jgi:hypothetical protein